MKTTIEIPDDLLRRARQLALDRGTTLRAIVEEALERALGPAVSGFPSVRTVTWPPQHSASTGHAKRGALEALLKAERNGSLDDPDYWMKRIGFGPPEVQKK